MKNIMKRYGYAVMSVSMILLYFVFTGGVTAEAVNPPMIEKSSTNPTALAVGREGSFFFTIYDINEKDIKTEKVCDPLGWQEVPQYITPSKPEWDYCIKDNSPGIPATGWVAEVLVPSINNNILLNAKYTCSFSLSFNTPGLKTVYLRSKAKRIRGESAWIYDSVKVNVTGSAPLAIKKYTFVRMAVQYYNADKSKKGTEQTFTFTDPANQYFELKGDDKIDLVFKWKPTAADLQKVPDLDANYDIRDFNKIYQVLNQTDWTYNIKYDQTRTVSFKFVETAGNASLAYIKSAKEGNGVYLTVGLDFIK